MRERVRPPRASDNRFAIRTLEEVAQIMFQERDPETGERLLPSPSKQNALNVERSAFRKMRLAAPELIEYLEGLGGSEREEQRGRFLAARGA